MPAFVWWTILVWNVIVCATYGVDKFQARREGRRVRESTLLWQLFLCAPVGAWVGMRWFRHKTRKDSFRWRAIACTVLNPLWLLCWLAATR